MKRSIGAKKTMNGTHDSTKFVNEIKRLLEISPDGVIEFDPTFLNAPDHTGETPLLCALSLGEDKVAQFLIQKGANVNLKNSDGLTPLHRALEKKKLLIAINLINKGAKVNAPDNTGLTPLHVAVKTRDSSIVKFLLQQNADVNAKDVMSFTPLHLAAENGDLAIARLLVEKKAKVNQKSRYGFSPLHHAVENSHVEIVKLLLKNGAKIDEKATAGFTPLHIAAENGHIEIVKLLLEKGANVDEKTADGLTPLHFAAENKDVQVIKVLLENNANISINIIAETTLLHVATTEGDLGLVKILLEKGADIHKKDDNGKTPLYYAAGQGHLEIMNLLIEKGAKVDATDNDSLTPLHFAAGYNHLETAKVLLEKGALIDAKSNAGYTPLSRTIQKAVQENKLGEYTEIVKMLIAQGGNIDEKLANGFTLLYYAIKNEDFKTANFLLKNGANIHEKMKDGFTPLEIAQTIRAQNVLKIVVENNEKIKNGFTRLHFAAQNGYLKMIKTLLQERADVNAEYIGGMVPLHAAAETGHLEIVKFLVENGAQINKKALNGCTPLHLAAQKGHLKIIEVLLEKGANIEEKTQVGWTPLHLAAQYGRLEIVIFLLRNGASTDEKTQDGWTPLHEAACNGHLEIVEFLVEFLLEKGAQINEKNQDGHTPLHLAALNGHLQTVKFLLEKGAQINEKNQDDHTPLHLAAEKGCLEIAKVLLEKGANIHEKAQDGCTPLHRAAYSGHLETVNFLLEKGANIHEKTQDGRTSLHLAASNGHLETVNFLLEKGANIHEKTQDGYTPLHQAVWYGHLDIVKFLLDQESTKIDGKASDDGVSLYLAASSRRGEIVDFLLKNGAPIIDATTKLELPEDIKITLQKHHELLQAIRNQDATQVKKLLDSGAILSKLSSLPALTPEIGYIILNREPNKTELNPTMQKLYAALEQAMGAAASTKRTATLPNWEIVLDDDKRKLSILFKILPKAVLELKKDDFHIKPLGSGALITLNDPAVLLHKEKLPVLVETLQTVLKQEVENKRSKLELQERENAQEARKRIEAAQKEKQKEEEKRNQIKEQEEKAERIKRAAENKANRERKEAKKAEAERAREEAAKAEAERARQAAEKAEAERARQAAEKAEAERARQAAAKAEAERARQAAKKADQALAPGGANHSLLTGISSKKKQKRTGGETKEEIRKSFRIHLNHAKKHLKKVQIYNRNNLIKEDEFVTESTLCYLSLVKLLTALHECHKIIEANLWLDFDLKDSISKNIESPGKIMALRILVIECFGREKFKDVIKQVSALFIKCTLEPDNGFYVPINDDTIEDIKKISNRKVTTAEDVQHILTQLKEIQNAYEKNREAGDLSSYLARHPEIFRVSQAWLVTLKVQWKTWEKGLIEEEKIVHPLCLWMKEHIFIRNIIVHEYDINYRQMAKFISDIPSEPLTSMPSQESCVKNPELENKLTSNSNLTFSQQPSSPSFFSSSSSGNRGLALSGLLASGEVTVASLRTQESAAKSPVKRENFMNILMCLKAIKESWETDPQVEGLADYLKQNVNQLDRAQAEIKKLGAIFKDWKSNNSVGKQDDCLHSFLTKFYNDNGQMRNEGGHSPEPGHQKIADFIDGACEVLNQLESYNPRSRTSSSSSSGNSSGEYARRSGLSSPK